MAAAGPVRLLATGEHGVIATLRFVAIPLAGLRVPGR